VRLSAFAVLRSNAASPGRRFAQTVRGVAWKAQIRLCTRYRRYSAAGKKRPVSPPLLREMTAFLWAIGRQVAAGRLIASAIRTPHRAAQRRGWSHGGESPSLVVWPGLTRRPSY
jgi:hypothetical protein